MANNYKIEKLPIPACELGEGPHWDGVKQELYFVDIKEGSVFRYKPATREYFKVLIGNGQPVSLVVPVSEEPNKYIISRGQALELMTWDGEAKTPSELKLIANVDENLPNNRFNDGKCDLQGRLWAGTMGYEEIPAQLDPKKGSLYSLGLNGQVIGAHVSEIDISNGLAWSKDSKQFYYIDSLTMAVDAFDFDPINGKISNRRVAFDFTKNGVKGLPDGMCCDSDDNLWVAVFMGKCVIQIDPRKGVLLQKIEIPGSENITSCCFGGPDLNELYITSAQIGIKPEDLPNKPDSGCTFKISNLGVTGQSAGIPYGGKFL